MNLSSGLSLSSSCFELFCIPAFYPSPVMKLSYYIFLPLLYPTVLNFLLTCLLSCCCYGHFLLSLLYPPPVSSACLVSSSCFELFFIPVFHPSPMLNLSPYLSLSLLLLCTICAPSSCFELFFIHVLSSNSCLVTSYCFEPSVLTVLYPPPSWIFHPFSAFTVLYDLFLQFVSLSVYAI